MYDLALAVEILNQIKFATELIIIRFKPIKSVDDLVSTTYGMEKLDSICMQLIVIGESLKNLDKVTNKELLPKYPKMEWKKIMGLRDIITHHYVDINADAIFDICENKVYPLSNYISKIIIDLS